MRCFGCRPSSSTLMVRPVLHVSRRYQATAPSQATVSLTSSPPSSSSLTSGTTATSSTTEGDDVANILRELEQKQQHEHLTATTARGIWMQHTGFKPKEGGEEFSRVIEIQKAFRLVDRKIRARYESLAAANRKNHVPANFVIRYMYDKFDLDGESPSSDSTRKNGRAVESTDRSSSRSSSNKKNSGGDDGHSPLFPWGLSRSNKHAFYEKLFARLSDDERTLLVKNAGKAYAKLMAEKRDKVRQRDKIRYYKESYSARGKGSGLVPPNAGQRWYPGLQRFQENRASGKKKKKNDAKRERIEGQSNVYANNVASLPLSGTQQSEDIKFNRRNAASGRRDTTKGNSSSRTAASSSIPIDKIIAKHGMEMTPGLSKKAKQLTAISMWDSFSATQRRAVMEYSSSSQ